MRTLSSTLEVFKVGFDLESDIDEVMDLEKKVKCSNCNRSVNLSQLHKHGCFYCFDSYLFVRRYY